jgi:hypothetical protein
LFDVDTQTGVELMRVSRAFAQRPDVYRRLSWQGLVELSAASMPWNFRRRLETAIMTGTKMTAVQIRRARLADATKRGQPALSIAA